MDCLILRFDAPLMSFGTVVVDQSHPVDRFPGTSMLTGLLGNALGWRHQDTKQLQSLQSRIQFAARWDREPELMVDYHTVDLGQEHLVETGWTTRGVREDRGTGEATKGTHITYRDYWAGGCMTLAVSLSGGDAPTLDDAHQALLHPARPLFLGRKTCLPASPILAERTSADSLREALRTAALPAGTPSRRLAACWPIDDSTNEGHTVEISDHRDWPQQLHVGSRRVVHGWLECGS